MRTKMKLGLLGLTLMLAMGSQANAGSVGYISTDRFGYTGTVNRYATLSDAQNQINETDTITIGNRDMALYIVNGTPSYDSNYNIVMGSWWYSTAVDSNGDPQGPGHGNTSGNTGVGFMQLYDSDGNSDTSISMDFSDFDGTHYTTFNLSLSGGPTTPGYPAGDAGRFSVYDNVNDGGIWHTYDLNLAAHGLEGNVISGNHIVATNHPTSVDGTFAGLFELTENQTSPANIGFYTVDLTLDMDNWSWDNRDDLVTYSFAPSEFATVPLPAAVWAGLMMMGSLGGVRVLRKKLQK